MTINQPMAQKRARFRSGERRIFDSGGSVTRIITSLTAAAEGAKTLDAWALDRLQLEETQRVQLLVNIERTAGMCMALSTLLKR